MAAPPYCEGPETEGFRAEVEENGILGFEDIEGAKGEEGAWEDCVGKEVGPGGLAAKGVGVKEGEGDRRADGFAPPMVVSKGARKWRRRIWGGSGTQNSYGATGGGRRRSGRGGGEMGVACFPRAMRRLTSSAVIPPGPASG